MVDQTNASTPQSAAAARANEEQLRHEQEQNKSFVEGARSVSEAIKRVADTAVAEASKVKAGPKPELIATGTAGGRITVNGEGFGPSGTLLLNGVQVKTLGWGTRHIEGVLPADARSGEVVVWVDPDTQRRGYLTL